MARHAIQISYETIDDAEPFRARAAEFFADRNVLTALFFWSLIGLALASVVNWMMG